MAKVLIGLDAGHGGSSSGTYSVNSTRDGLFEKHYALDLVKRINERLIEHGFKTVLTRTADVNPGNVSKRAEMLVKAGCDFALSVHFNGFGNESANGCEVFVPYEERAAGIEAGFYKYLGKFFKLRAPFARSNSYYNRNDTFDKKLNVSTRKFEAYDDQKDYFGFVRTCWENGVSADLLEVCFLTNPGDFKTYTEKTDEIADAIARSIVEGYGEVYNGIEKPEEIPVETVPEEKALYRVQVGAFFVKENAEAMLDSLKAAGFDGFIVGGK